MEVIDNKKYAALILELKEQLRRQMVLNGECTEEESNKKLHEEL